MERSSYLRNPEFLQRRRVLCLVGRERPQPARKGEPAIYLCTAEDIAATLTSLHWCVGTDFYLFDKTGGWFIAALRERLYMMDDHGEYPLLIYREG